MSPKKDRPHRPTPTAEERKARLALRAEEGALAWAEYQTSQQAALDQMATLRAQRLARVIRVEPPKVKAPRKRKLA